MSELVKRLREAIKYCDKEKQILMMLLIRDAADEIERLEKWAFKHMAEDANRRQRIEELEKERDELKESVRRCLPFNDDGMTIDEVLKELESCAHEIAFARPESPIEFMDGETLRTIIYEEGDSSVGIQGGYVTNDEIDLDDLKAKLAKYEGAE